MTSGDGGLDNVGANGFASASARFSAASPRRISSWSQRPVLGLQQDRRAVGADPGRNPRGLQLQQGLEAVNVGFARHQFGQHPGQPDRFVAEVRAHPVESVVARSPR